MIKFTFKFCRNLSAGEIRKAFIQSRARNMVFNYPEAKRDESVKDVYHSVEVPDPYRWLEDADSVETSEFINAQNAITRPYLDECPYKSSITKKITKLWNFPKLYTPSRQGDKYFQFRNTGLQNQNVMYILDNVESEGKVFLDPNALSEDGTISLSNTAFSKDGKVMAYGLSKSGSDWIEIKFKNVLTGEDFPETLSKVKYSAMAWTHDNKGIFYGAYLEQKGKTDGSETVSAEYQKLYYHLLGTDQSEDVIVVEFDNPKLRIGAEVSDCGNYLVLIPLLGCKDNLLYFAHLESEIKQKFKLHEVVTEFDSDYEYITNNGSKFVFRTNKEAPNYKLVIIDFNNPKQSAWKNLIEEHPVSVLTWASPINNNQLVVCYLHDVKNIMSLHKLESGEKIMDFPVELGTITGMTGERKHTEMFYGFYSFLTPNKLYRVDFTKPEVEITVLHETKVGDFDPSKYEAKQVFYSSKDGTQVPMFIVHKKGFENDGTKPCLLYGYGGFNVNVTPFFAVSRLIFINHFDGIYALANIRGGGEYGDKWHNGGRYGNKQNCFDDFQHAAKYLIKEKYTNSNKLIIQGGSNGGLLVAACINQAPELFGAAICQVGVLDMLRYHKFTIGYAWKSDYGSSEEEAAFQYLYKYSPLHNINIPKNGNQYPATLLFTADHDDRVVPLHSLKFIAELQNKIGKLPQQTNPLMIRVETRAGHGAGKPTTKIVTHMQFLQRISDPNLYILQIDELTDTYCFVARSLNLTFQE